ncbi:hypothetical protein EYF80_051556 [Liparis tanakae]|uniref:Uncharacterized protein n=1 Tax=Liparis tanakae TaxID=230148 RepID=A0A4Z2FBX7_9TELE|nr:hypothetical protein EYF80_051556 [Liparis tanakae]
MPLGQHRSDLQEPTTETRAAITAELTCCAETGGDLGQTRALCVTPGGVWQDRGGGVVLLDGLMRFSFCRRLQNQTRITSFSMVSWSAMSRISSEVGFWFWRRKRARG